MTMTGELFQNAAVQQGKRVAAREWVYVDDELARVLAWNNLPTYFVEIERNGQIKEVEPWRIKKIEKVD